MTVEDLAEAGIVCSGCGEGLGNTVTQGACPACGALDTAICSACGEGLRGGESYCPRCGADLRKGVGPEPEGEDDTGRGDDIIAHLRFGDQVIPVRDGEDIGLGIRRALILAGESVDEARRVHRQHLRILEEDGALYVRRLGRNSVKVNGEEVPSGDRCPVEDGGLLELSNGIELEVEVLDE